MSSSKTVTSTLSDTAFNKQADAVHDALKNFETISTMNNALDLAKTAMETLLSATVSLLFACSVVLFIDLESASSRSMVSSRVMSHSQHSKSCLSQSRMRSTPTLQDTPILWCLPTFRISLVSSCRSRTLLWSQQRKVSSQLAYNMFPLTDLYISCYHRC